MYIASAYTQPHVYAARNKSIATIEHRVTVTYVSSECIENILSVGKRFFENCIYVSDCNLKSSHVWNVCTYLVLIILSTCTTTKVIYF